MWKWGEKDRIRLVSIKANRPCNGGHGEQKTEPELSIFCAERAKLGSHDFHYQQNSRNLHCTVFKTRLCVIKDYIACKTRGGRSTGRQKS